MRDESKKEIALTLLGPLAWVFHFMTLYVLYEFSCVARAPALLWTFYILTGASLLVTGYGLRRSLGVTRYGVICNAIFFGIIIYQSVPYFYLRGQCL